jgi:hypothetical protein
MCDYKARNGAHMSRGPYVHYSILCPATEEQKVP